MGFIENVKPSEPKVTPAKKPATRGGPPTPMGAESDTTQRHTSVEVQPQYVDPYNLSN